MPALNELLGRFGLELSDHVVTGPVTFSRQGNGFPSKIALSAATTVRRAPPGAHLLRGPVNVKKTPPNTPPPPNAKHSAELAIGAYVALEGGGRVAVLGDSGEEGGRAEAYESLGSHYL